MFIEIGLLLPSSGWCPEPGSIVSMPEHTNQLLIKFIVIIVILFIIIVIVVLIIIGIYIFFYFG